MNLGFRKNMNVRRGENFPSDSGNAVCAMDLLRLARENPYSVATLWTGKGLQAGVMSVPVGQTRTERASSSDSMIIFVGGMGEVRVGALGCRGERRLVSSDGNTFFIPSGEVYDVINTGKVPLQVIFVHAPAAFPHGTRY